MAMTLKSISIILFCNCVILFPPPSSAEDEATKAGTVNFILGEATVKHRGVNDWENMHLKMILFEGDMVQTSAESRLEIKLLDESIIRIGEQTELEISRVLLQEESAKFQATLKQGQIWANIVKLRRDKDEVQIKAPTAVCAVRGTVYRMNADSTTTVLVYDGSVDVGPLWMAEQYTEATRPRELQPVEIPAPHEIPPPYEVTLDEWIQIVRGFQIVVRQDGKYAKSKYDEEEDAKLEWVEWNKQRDLRIGRN